MNIITKILDRKGSPILVVGFIVLFILEKRQRLRKRKEMVIKRSVKNLIVAIPAFALLRFMFLPAMVKIANKSQQLNWGLNNRYIAPGWVKMASAFLILDLSNYLWHILNHKIAWLWRFHVVHHSDKDLDVTTAIRFHFGEMIGSVIFRGLFVFLSGASAKTVLVYEILFEGATQFHHSNLQLSIEKERLLNKLIVTPRMHGIHHSVVRQETDSNYSVIFSFWDRIFNTVCLNVPQDEVIIGVPGYTQAEDLTVGDLLKLPFKKLRKNNSASSDYKQASYSQRNQLHI
jgi:sterol desaturase/sphingolipid hydroxylase (fatty acid hydroxylase superfamily)